MEIRYDQLDTTNMNQSERAAQLWPLLAWAATNRQTLTYDIVARLSGVPRPALGRFLEPIQSYCLEHELPPLTAVVVSSQDGRPSAGFTASDDPLRTFLAVFEHDWLETQSPTPESLAVAVANRPSNGPTDG